MTDITALREIERRLSEAKEGDRALDLDIARTLCPDVIVMRQRDDDSGSDPYTHWKCTASLDSAIALCERVLPGWSIQVRTENHRENGWQADVWCSWGPTAYQRSVAAARPSPALALCLAIVRALISMGRDE